MTARYYKLNNYDRHTCSFPFEPMWLIDDGMHKTVIFEQCLGEIVAELPLNTVAKMDAEVCKRNNWKKLPGDIVFYLYDCTRF